MSSSHELVCIFKVFNQRSNPRSSYQPPLEGTRVVCKTYRPSIPLAASIILLMCLMNWDIADIVGVVQSNEPGDTFCQSIEVHAEGGLPLGPHKDQ